MDHRYCEDWPKSISGPRTRLRLTIMRPRLRVGIGESKERTERSLIQSFDLVSGNGRLSCNSSSGQKLPLGLVLLSKKLAGKKNRFCAVIWPPVRQREAITK